MTSSASNPIVTVHLPSLIHRIGGEHVKAAKLIAVDCRCELKRIRRSRHWQASGAAQNLAQFNERLIKHSPECMRYLVGKLEDKLATCSDMQIPLEEKLKVLVMQTPHITLSELMAATNCSIAQARTARFEADVL